MTRNQNHVSASLCYTRSNCTNTRGCNKFNSHFTAWINLFEIINQLCQVLDRVNIMVRRRANQRHAFGRMTKTRDKVGHLHPRQLPSLARLCPLSNLNFKLFTMIEILSRHTKAARGHLFYFCRWIITICFRREMRRVFATFTTIRFSTYTVHSYVESFMSFRAERTKRHARGHKTLTDCCNTFHFININCDAHRLDC